jgi:hypothetical protein
MEALYFLMIWIGSALVHTFFDLKVKPHFGGGPNNSDEWPNV